MRDDERAPEPAETEQPPAPRRLPVLRRDPHDETDADRDRDALERYRYDDGD